MAPVLFSSNTQSAALSAPTVSAASVIDHRVFSQLFGAAIITLALFFIMERLIAVDFAPAPLEDVRVIDRITPERVTSDVRSETFVTPEKLPLAERPPPPPRYSANKSDIDLPTPSVRGAAPAGPVIDQNSLVDFSLLEIPAGNLRPLRQPVVTYPQRALSRGLEGDCVVRLDVDTTGRPFNVMASCSDAVFVANAEAAVRRVEFVPQLVNGRAVIKRNVILPIAFTLE
ncbi:MAG: TonB family protein [Pseudomonadota bacterium]